MLPWRPVAAPCHAVSQGDLGGVMFAFRQKSVMGIFVNNSVSILPATKLCPLQLNNLQHIIITFIIEANNIIFDFVLVIIFTRVC